MEPTRTVTRAPSWMHVDTAIGDLPGITAARVALGVSRSTMVGMLVLLEAEMLAHHPSGFVADVELPVLIEWADFHGDPSAFASALNHLTDETGKLRDWDRRHGVRLARLAREAQRKRTERASAKRRLSDVGRTHMTGRGDVRPERPERGKGGDLVRSAKPSSSTGPDAHPPEPSGTTDEIRATLRPGAREFFDTFYPRKGTHIKRRRDAIEILGRLNEGRVVSAAKGKRCRAGSPAELEAGCLALIAAGVRTPEGAIGELLERFAITEP